MDMLSLQPIQIFICVAAVLYIVLLYIEFRAARANRAKLKHVVHVNGTRGKSTVTRLIAAGLTGGGMRVYCKTTGTLPMTIDPEGNEKLILRRGSANIKEQIDVLKAAASDQSDVLVAECMAVDPELQYVCEHKIFHSDIGVITNARIDHEAEMGSRLEDVRSALSNTIPKNAVVFTADPDAMPAFTACARGLGSEAVLTLPDEDCLSLADQFPENTALALAVCERLGVSREDALRGMHSVKNDPYVSSRHNLPDGSIFINAMSANDPVSTGMVIDSLASGDTQGREIIYLLNCRADRGYRTGLMCAFIAGRSPDAVWLMGRGTSAAKLKLKKLGYPGSVTVFPTAQALPVVQNNSDSKRLICALGNIAGPGLELMEIIKEEEKKCTRK